MAIIGPIAIITNAAIIRPCHAFIAAIIAVAMLIVGACHPMLHHILKAIAHFNGTIIKLRPTLIGQNVSHDLNLGILSIDNTAQDIFHDTVIGFIGTREVAAFLVPVTE